jgi:hypothetical protein
MKHLYWFITDMILELIEGVYRIKNIFHKKAEPSLIASNVFWVTDSQWMERLECYKQLELWTADK